MSADLGEILPRFAATKLRERYRFSKGKAKADGETSMQDVADELGISKPQVHALLTRGKGMGPKVERAIAEKFYGGSVDRLHRAALAWAETAEGRYGPALALARQVVLLEVPGIDPAFVEAWSPPAFKGDEITFDQLRDALKNAWSEHKGKRAVERGDPLADLGRPGKRRR